MTKLKEGKFSFEITNEDKVFFPKEKITKGDLINYYSLIGPIMVKYTKDRALTMHRFPNGITKEGFYHKDAPDFFPKWIKRFEVKKQDEGVVHYVVANNIATLAYIANYGCITPHLWLSKIDKLDYPDRIIFDLDPSNEKQFNLVCQTAKEMKKILDELGYSTHVMSTGSRGLHVVIPIKRTKTFDEARNFAREIAKKIIEQDPKNLTLEIRKQKRGKRVFIDVIRNSFSATGVAPYAVRAKPGAPVAAPLYWEELDEKDINPQKYNISNIFVRLKKDGDPWKDINKFAKAIKNS